MTETKGRASISSGRSFPAIPGLQFRGDEVRGVREFIGSFALSGGVETQRQHYPECS
jgi:hypothetical protein